MVGESSRPRRSAAECTRPVALRQARLKTGISRKQAVDSSMPPLLPAAQRAPISHGVDKMGDQVRHQRRRAGVAYCCAPVQVTTTQQAFRAGAARVRPEASKRPPICASSSLRPSIWSPPAVVPGRPPYVMVGAGAAHQVDG